MNPADHPEGLLNGFPGGNRYGFFRWNIFLAALYPDYRGSGRKMHREGVPQRGEVTASVTDTGAEIWAVVLDTPDRRIKAVVAPGRINPGLKSLPGVAVDDDAYEGAVP